MNILNRTVGACLLVGALWPTVPALAATYYVAVTGNNSNPGTEKQPWGTITHAVATMDPGDTTYVRGGTYNENEIRFSISGTPSAPIKLLNYPGEAPVIHFNHPEQFHRILIQHKYGSHRPMGWITIEGFEIANAYDGIKMHSGHDLTIRRNWIHDSVNKGILGNGTRILIDRNRINHIGRFFECQAGTYSCRLDHGIYMNGVAIRITNNLIYDNLCFGVQANGRAKYDPAKHPGPEYLHSSDWVIANNTFAYNGCSGIVVWGSSLVNLRIKNNILYENAVQKPTSSVQGIHFVTMTSRGIVINNNHFFASGPGGILAFGLGAIEGVHYSKSDNIVNVSDPRFLNAPASLPLAPDFSLTAHSPAIDMGVTLTSTQVAFDGTSRPQGAAYDIGAYEYEERDAPGHHLVEKRP